MPTKNEKWLVLSIGGHKHNTRTQTDPLNQIGEYLGIIVYEKIDRDPFVAI